MRILFITLFCISTLILFGQDSKTVAYGNLSIAVGERQGSASVDYYYNWRLLSTKKIEVGIGGRFTSYLGSSKYYSSAPADLAGNEIFSDSLILQSPQINALNIALNFGYRISEKFGIGFNIDAIGFSFGSEKSGSYINGNQGQATAAKPTSLNLLLVGNNDKGSLNSEFYLRYFFTEKIAMKAAFQYLFTEYTTETKVQQQPEPNDRFRNKAGLLSIGITKQF